MAQAGCTRLFPDCVPYENKNGVCVVEPASHAVVPVSQKTARVGREQIFNSIRTRHLMSHWIDVTGIAERTKRRILGHAPNGVGDVYGAKGSLDPAEAKVISECLTHNFSQDVSSILASRRVNDADVGDGSAMQWRILDGFLPSPLRGGGIRPKPGECSLDDPSAGQDLEAFGRTGSFDDLECSICPCRQAPLRSLGPA